MACNRPLSNAVWALRSLELVLADETGRHVYPEVAAREPTWFEEPPVEEYGPVAEPADRLQGRQQRRSGNRGGQPLEPPGEVGEHQALWREQVEVEVRGEQASEPREPLVVHRRIGRGCLPGDGRCGERLDVSHDRDRPARGEPLWAAQRIKGETVADRPALLAPTQSTCKGSLPARIVFVGTVKGRSVPSSPRQELRASTMTNCGGTRRSTQAILSRDSTRTAPGPIGAKVTRWTRLESASL